MKRGTGLWEEFRATGRAADCPVYDMHAHMGPWYGIHFPAPEAGDMVHSMDRAGVKLLIFSHHAALFTPDLGNQPAIDAVRRFPQRLRAYCGINPNYPAMLQRELDTFDQYRDVYVGFKFLSDYHSIPATDDRCRLVWEYANDRKLLVLLHTWGGSPNDGPEVVRRAAEKHPDARILMGHSCHGEWDKAIALVRDFPNVYLELCAVLDERGVVEKMVAEAGSRQIVFGTDMPWFGYHYYLGALLGAGLPEEDCRNILYRNAERLLRLPAQVKGPSQPGAIPSGPDASCQRRAATSSHKGPVRRKRDGGLRPARKQ